MKILLYFWEINVGNPPVPTPSKLCKPYYKSISNFRLWGVFIRPDVGQKILRPMVKELALYDLRFLSYGHLKKMAEKKTVFWP